MVPRTQRATGTRDDVTSTSLAMIHLRSECKLNALDSTSQAHPWTDPARPLQLTGCRMRDALGYWTWRKFCLILCPHPGVAVGVPRGNMRQWKPSLED